MYLLKQLRTNNGSFQPTHRQCLVRESSENGHSMRTPVSCALHCIAYIPVNTHDEDGSEPAISLFKYMSICWRHLVGVVFLLSLVSGPCVCAFVCCCACSSLCGQKEARCANEKVQRTFSEFHSLSHALELIERLRRVLYAQGWLFGMFVRQLWPSLMA